MRLVWYDLFLGILESSASFSMYVLTSYPLGSSVEGHIKSAALSEESTFCTLPPHAPGAPAPPLPRPRGLCRVRALHLHVAQDRLETSFGGRGPQLISHSWMLSYCLPPIS